MLGGIFNEIKQLFGGSATRTITVAKPYCSPARNVITAAFTPYGVKIHHLHGWTEITQHDGCGVPIADMAKVTVNAKAAAWAEYLLLRTGKLRIVGSYIDARNEA